MAVTQALHNVCIAKVAYGLALGRGQFNTLTGTGIKKKKNKEDHKRKMFCWKLPAEFSLKAEA